MIFNSLFRGFGVQLAKYFGPLVALVLLLFLFLTLNVAWDVFAKWGWVNPPGAGTERTTTLTAQGKAIAITDTARFNVSVVTRGDDPETIEQQNAEKTNAIIAFLKENGVAEEDIKTIQFNLFPRNEFRDGRQIPVGFELTQTVQVKTKVLDSVGALLAGSIERGANQVSNITFFVDDPDVYRAQARQQALAKIETKKKELAREVGLDFGKVVNFSESLSGQPPIAFTERAIDTGIGGGVPEPALEPGSQEITVNVSVTYELD